MKRRQDPIRKGGSDKVCHGFYVILLVMEGRLVDQGYVAADFQLADVGSDFESFYNISSTEKKLTQLTAPSSSSSYYRADPREHAMDLRGFSTGVSVEESALLDDAIDYFDARRERDRSNFGSLTDLSFSGSLTELDNQTSSGAQHSFKLSSYDQEQENREPATRRVHPSYGMSNYGRECGTMQSREWKSYVNNT